MWTHNKETNLNKNLISYVHNALCQSFAGAIFLQNLQLEYYCFKPGHFIETPRSLEACLTTMRKAWACPHSLKEALSRAAIGAMSSLIVELCLVRFTTRSSGLSSMKAKLCLVLRLPSSSICGQLLTAHSAIVRSKSIVA